MPALIDPRHEAFALAISQGVKREIAYDQAFGREPRKDVTGKTSASRVGACRLANRPEVIKRIQELAEKQALNAIDNAVVDRMWVIGRFLHLAVTARNEMVQLRAAENLAKCVHMPEFTPTELIQSNRRSPADLPTAELRQLVQRLEGELRGRPAVLEAAVVVEPAQSASQDALDGHVVTADCSADLTEG